MAFDEPNEGGGGDRLDVKTIVDKLIIVRPHRYLESQITVHKPQGGEAVFANVAVLQPHDGEPYKIFRGVMFMQGFLVGAFKGKMPRDLLGTIWTDVPTKGNPPDKFKSLTGNAKAREMAEQWMAEHQAEFYDTETSFSEPAATGAGNTARSQWDDEPPF